MIYMGNINSDVNRNINCVKFFKQNKEMFTKYLTDNEQSIAINLMDFISPGDCFLREKNGEFITIDYICRLFEYDDNTIRNIIYSLRRKGVLGMHNTGKKKKFTFNPYIAFKGDSISSWMLKFCENTIWAKNILNMKQSK